MSSVWTGTITLGVLQVPVQLYACITDERIGFRQLCPRHSSPIEQRTYCRAGGERVERNEMLKGYETENEKFVVLTADEIASAGLPISKVLEIEVCVPESDLDFRYFDKPYVAVPPKKDPGKLYALVRAALASTGHVAIGRITIRTKQHIAAVRVLGEHLLIQLMHWPDEVNPLSEHEAPQAEVKPAELQLAEMLVGQMVGEFTPTSFVDQYRENLLALIGAKSRGEEVTFTAPEEPAAAGTDVMALLQASIAAAAEKRRAA
jgi:DNA end-binding protein Ku